MTKASEGSQLPATSKKLMTLAGLAMPESTMPGAEDHADEVDQDETHGISLRSRGGRT